MIEHMIPAPPAEKTIALIKGELASRRRWFYRCVMVAAILGLSALLSLWLTEPTPLPIRLHLAFAGLTAVLVGWIGVLGWILLRRSCPTADDRVATSWMATLASALFTAVGVPIAWFRSGPMMGASLAAMGIALLVIAGMMLARAYRLRKQLRQWAAEFEAQKGS